MRVVIDTSVVVSAARSAFGASKVVIDWLDEGKIQAVVSMKLVLEYESLLRRQIDATGWTVEEVINFLDVICEKCQQVAPTFSYRPSIADPDDEFLVELAFAAGVDYLITLNPKDFAGSVVFGVELISPGEFVRRQREAQ
jgi:putative PIN family toxin of toxin-antitoxin system